MEVFHERTFRVRHYECDAYGHVNHANYVRYMQEAAFDASAAVGYDVARYEELGLYWLIRQTEVTYLRPLIFGDSVIVKTWVENFRRVRSRRAYELRSAHNNEIVAQAYTDWVLLDTANERLATIPDEMIQAFLPSAFAENSSGNGRIPKAPPPPANPYKMRQVVAWRDLDPAQHVNNATYLSYLEDAGTRVIAYYGWPLNRLAENEVGIVARKLQIEYKTQAVLDDELEITTYLADVKRATAVRHYIIRRVSDNALIAQANMLNVCVDMRSGLPRKFPAYFLDALQDNIA